MIGNSLFFCLYSNINAGDLIFSALNSLINQTFKDFEIIIVDNNSNNEILKFFDDYEEIEEFNFNTKRRWTLYKNFRSYKKSIFKYLNQINPLAIVSCSDMATQPLSPIITSLQM